MKIGLLFGMTLGGAIAAPGLLYAADRVKTRMPVNFLGVNIGTVTSLVEVDGSAYSIKGQAASNSLVSVVAKVRATFESSGRVKGRGVVPQRHNLSYRQRKKKGLVKFAFARGNISNVSITPKIKYAKTAVPVVPSHLRAVLDPISSLMLPVKAGEVGNGGAVCDRIIPVFDGKTRMNLRLSYKSSRERTVSGFSGPVFTCAIRYQPVAGHRPERKETKFMQSNRNMEISVARVGQSNVYSLFGFRVKTKAGMASGLVNQFQSY